MKVMAVKESRARAGGGSGRRGRPAQVEPVDEDDPAVIRAIARGFAVLRAFDPSSNALSHTQICERTKLPAPTVTRILKTLSALRYVSVDASGKFYSLHPHVLSLGYPVLASYDLRQVARPLMQELADHSKGTVALGVRNGAEMIYIERAREKTVVTAYQLDIGSRLAIAESAMGRAWLAGQPAATLEATLDDLAVVYGTGWPEVRAGIERALEVYRARGYVVSLGDWEKSTHAVGVPVFRADGSCLGLTCGGPAHRIKLDMIEDLGHRVVALAEQIRMIDTAR